MGMTANVGQFISHAFALLPHVVPDTPGSVRASKRKRAHTAIDAESDEDPIPPTSSTASKRQKPVAKPRPGKIMFVLVMQPNTSSPSFSN